MKGTSIVLTTAAIALMLTSCFGGNKKNAEGTEEATASTAPAANVVEIFNGKDFTGWRGYNLPGMPESGRWTVEDGAMKINGNGKGEGDDNIIFATPFRNFKFTFEYKVGRGSNSGVFFYAKEIPGGPIYITAPEYQILDNENHPDARLGVDGNRASASLYDMMPAKPQNAKPFGEWNTGGIMVFKGTVIHYQNEVPVVEYHLWTPEWTALIENSKFSSTNPNWPDAFKLLTSGLGTDDAGNVVGGYIALQDHGDDVWFRNLKVEILD
ncbi:MAG: DUF1080 domain-containing protein [Alistipes sp.]|jgi:hypothetical protein|nr:DUF1080 domain-containing protein [Alistipes sp.]